MKAYIGLIALLMANGCDAPGGSDQSDAIDVADTNARNALHQIQQLSDRVDDLEAHRDRLTLEAERLQGEVDLAKAEAEEAAQAARNHDLMFH